MRSLRAKILTIVLAFLALIGIAFLVYSLFTTENYKQMRLAGIEQTIQIEIEKVNKFIAEMERAAIFFVTAGELVYEAQQERELAETLALELFRSFPAAIGGGFWFAPYAFNENTYREGVYAFFDKELGVARLDDTFFIDEYDYHNQSWYTEIAARLYEPYQVVWTRPYIDDTGSYALMTTAGAGIFDDNGNLIALSTVDWEIDEVITQLTAIRPTENSFIILCCPAGGYGITNTLTRTAGLDLSHLPWGINDNLVTLEGVDYLAFRGWMDNGWLLLVYVPTDEIFAEVEQQNTQFTQLIIGLSLIMMCLAFLLIANILIKPLKKLIDGVSHLGLGKLDITIDIKSKDELGLLAGTFNKMTSDLKNSIEEKARERERKERFGANVRDVLTKVAKSPALSSGDYRGVAKFLAEQGLIVMDVTRVEVWMVTDFKNGVENLATFDISRGGYVERGTTDLENYEEYEQMLKAERLITTNDVDKRKAILESRDSFSVKTIASLEAPVWINGELAGIICIEQEPSELYPEFREWTTEEDSFTISIADIMAVAIFNNERRIMMHEAGRMAAELNVATQIQTSMLPCIFPAFPHRDEFDIYAIMQPAKEVGGDFYDFFMVDEHILAMVVADVSGKGIPAALFMVIAKTLIKNNVQSGKSPKEVFETVNEMLCENNEAQMFVTVFMGIWDMRTGTFTYINAGHNPPLIKRAGGDYEWLPTKPGFVIAGMEGMKYKQDELVINEGDTIFMYTDGVTEAENLNKELFGESRLIEKLNSNKYADLIELITSIKNEIDLFF